MKRRSEAPVRVPPPCDVARAEDEVGVPAAAISRATSAGSCEKSQSISRISSAPSASARWKPARYAGPRPFLPRAVQDGDAARAPRRAGRRSRRCRRASCRRSRARGRRGRAAREPCARRSRARCRWGDRRWRARRRISSSGWRRRCRGTRTSRTSSTCSPTSRRSAATTASASRPTAAPRTRVRETAAPVAELAVAGRAKELQGIGKTIEEKIVQIVEDGEIEALTRRKAEIPREVVLFMRLPGLGPKSAKKIWQELGITTLDGAARGGRGAAAARAAGHGREDRGERPARARGAGRGRGAAAHAARPRAAGAEGGRLGARRASGLRPGLDRRQRAPLPGDGARPRHHRDGERPGRADRLLHEAALGRRRRGEGPDEGDGRLARRLPLRPARRAARVLRQPAPALHRLEGPQRRAARGGRAAQALRLRVRRAEHRDRRDVHRAHRGGAVPLPRLRLHPARAARELRRARGRARTASCRSSSSWATCAATCTRTRTGRRTARTRSRRWCRSRDRARLRLLRDHRPLALPARGAARGAGGGDRGAAGARSRRSGSCAASR